MAIYSFPITDHKHGILRTIAIDVVRDLAQYLSLKQWKEIPIVYIDEEGTRKEANTHLNAEEREGIYTGGERRINIVVTEEEQEGSFYQNQEYHPDFLPIFKEEITGTDITPYYSHTILRIEITHVAQSKTEAKAWQNEIKSRARRIQDVFPHNLEYKYDIDRRAIYILYEVWRLIKNRNNKVEPFSDWLQNHFSNRLSTTSDTAGLNFEYSLSENQHQVMGYFDFPETIEQGDKVDGNNTWVTRINYMIRYFRPTTISVNYPLVVYNQIVPETLLAKETVGVQNTYISEENPKSHLFHTVSGKNLAHFSALEQADTFIQHSGIIIPHWNEFSPEQLFSIRGTERFIDQLILFTEDDFVQMSNHVDQKLVEYIPLYDLNKIPEVTIKPELLKFLISEGSFMLHEARSIFQVLLYKNSRALTRGHLAIGKNGDIYLRKPLTVDGTYNLRIAVYYDWTLVDSDAIKRLINAGLHDALKDYLSSKIPHGQNWEFNEKGGRLKTVQTFFTINYDRVFTENEKR